MVPFKTPLDARYNDQVPPQFLFTPAMLMTWAESAEVRRNGPAHGAAQRGPCPHLTCLVFGPAQIKIGLIIDLTKVRKDRFYAQDEFTQRGVREVVKISCAGYITFCRPSLRLRACSHVPWHLPHARIPQAGLGAGAGSGGCVHGRVQSVPYRASRRVHRYERTEGRDSERAGGRQREGRRAGGQAGGRAGGRAGARPSALQPAAPAPAQPTRPRPHPPRPPQPSPPPQSTHPPSLPPFLLTGMNACISNRCALHPRVQPHGLYDLHVHVLRARFCDGHGDRNVCASAVRFAAPVHARARGACD